MYGEKVDLPNSENAYRGKPSVSVTIKEDLSYYINEREINPIDIELELIAALKGQEQREAVLYVDEMVPTGFTINLLAIARNNDIAIVVATEAIE